MHDVAIRPQIVDRVMARRGRFHLFHKLQPEKTALVIIDMQNTFLRPGAPVEVPKGRDIVGGINRLTSRLRVLEVPVIWVTHANSREGDGSDWPSFFDVFVAADVRGVVVCAAIGAAVAGAAAAGVAVGVGVAVAAGADVDYAVIVVVAAANDVVGAVVEVVGGVVVADVVAVAVAVAVIRIRIRILIHIRIHIRIRFRIRIGIRTRIRVRRIRIGIRTRIRVRIRTQMTGRAWC